LTARPGENKRIELFSVVELAEIDEKHQVIFR
jgi:hypothetical protein